MTFKFINWKDTDNTMAQNAKDLQTDRQITEDEIQKKKTKD